MAEQTLIQRLRDRSQIDPHSHVDTGLLLESVLEHLQRLFNTRQGSVATRDDYGLPDFNDLIVDRVQMMPSIIRTMRQQIEKFEPRIHNVSVKHIPDPDKPLSLYFQVSGELKLDHDQEKITFETMFGSGGSVRIS
ncbi:MAG TPA: type VI secretion system baseplate subunit TssE [Alphaproteobacteria bacterium]|nr:type VI secretion system baseplate subunit TssE [Paracoccaceae bacterium]RCL79269.1 MAG: type VI secretion system baseplate subunit TssE [SAR116 cluster bacterium]HCJ62166.1 type VI secretion system baseplate subunit TssE [Alphaproteobacteria bacterium]HCY47437.1 type VI secretion system baseplate subunit TssE [Alphaproteobacteria bacterium]|tara:strand:+ start:8096 stop:8503 length:408 start_codon:yes stop_codon:yes gene_type:complete